MLAQGQRIGHYEVEAEIGGGGMGRVYRVRHVLLNSLHAMKVLLPELAVDEELRGRFLTEGQIQATLRHPNIVPVTDLVAEDDVAALVMDFVDGDTLASIVSRAARPLDSAFVRSVFTQVLDALGHAHESGIVHRDIKPANILVARGKGGTPKVWVLDFGIAKVADAAKLTRTGARMGTPNYMSPEQILGAREVTPRSDIFSVGVTLFEAATGTACFPGDNDFKIQLAIANGQRRKTTEANPGVDPAIAAAAEKALAIDPLERFENCAEFALALVRPGSEVLARPGLGVAAWPAASSPPPARPVRGPPSGNSGRFDDDERTPFPAPGPGPVTGLAGAWSALGRAAAGGLGPAAPLPSPPRPPAGPPSPFPASGPRSPDPRKAARTPAGGAAPPATPPPWEAPTRKPATPVSPSEPARPKSTPLPVALSWPEPPETAVPEELRALVGEVRAASKGAAWEDMLKVPESRPPPARPKTPLPPPPTPRPTPSGGGAGASRPPTPRATPVSFVPRSEPGDSDVPALRRPRRRRPLVWAAAGAVLLATAAAYLLAGRGTGSVADGEFVAMHGGRFHLGCEADDTRCRPEEKPGRDVSVAPFQLARTETTVDAYAGCVQAGVCTEPGTDDAACNWAKGRGNHPVNCVDWEQARHFCEHMGGRLPTEAEWEWAAKGGGSRRYPWGDPPPSCQRTIMDEGVAGCGRVSTWPVCSKTAGRSAQGLCDLSGNVWEWVSDWYAEGFAAGLAENPTGPAGGTHKVGRGGGWGSTGPGGLRTSVRDFALPTGRYAAIGFRCARGAEK